MIFFTSSDTELAFLTVLEDKEGCMKQGSRKAFPFYIEVVDEKNIKVFDGR